MLISTAVGEVIVHTAGNPRYSFTYPLICIVPPSLFLAAARVVELTLIDDDLYVLLLPPLFSIWLYDYS